MFRGNAPEVVDAEAVRKSFDTSSGSLVLRYRYGSKGFTAPTWEGYPTAVTGALLALTSAPTVTGTAKVGSTVKVRSNGSWTLTPSSYAYQWLRNGQAIKGATKTSHKVTNAHSGRPLSLRVTAKKAGHASGVATSKVLKVPKTSASLA